MTKPVMNYEVLCAGCKKRCLELNAPRIRNLKRRGMSKRGRLKGVKPWKEATKF